MIPVAGGRGTRTSLRSTAGGVVATPWLDSHESGHCPWDPLDDRMGSVARPRGVAIYGVADGQPAWCRFYLEPIDEGGEGINAATRQAVTGVSGPPKRKDGSA